MAEIPRARLKNLAAVVAIGGLLAAGCSRAGTTSGGGTPAPTPAPATPAAAAAPGGPPAPPAAPAGPTTITYLNTAIDRATEDVAVGAKVVWMNAETNGTPHNVTSGTVQGTVPQPDGKFASPRLVNAGEKFEHTFSAPGAYHYYCAVHPAQMQGTINVH